MKDSPPERPGLLPFLLQSTRANALPLLLPTLSAGIIAGLMEVTLTISFAALIFTGPLAEFVPSAVGLNLMGAAIAGLVTALLTSLPGIISGNQDVPAAIFAVMAAAIVARMPAAATATEIFVTVVAAIGLTTSLCGAVLFALGRFRLGGLVRFLPYPVVGGFLAGTGWLLAVGAVGVLTGVEPSLANAPLLFTPAQLARWLPGIIMACAILFTLRRSQRPLFVPLIILVAIAVFYLIAALTNTTVAALSAGGWLLGPFPSQQLWQPVLPADLLLVNWSVIGSQLVNIGTIIALSTVALLLNATGVELATGRDANLNQELRAAGLGNLGAGLVGGMVGYQQLSISAINHKLGAANRATGLVAAGFCLAILFLGTAVLSLFPKMILGALLFYLGLSFLVDWLVDRWSTLPRADYLVVVLILGVTALIGFLEAVGVGLLAAVALFVVNYSRVDVVHDELDAACYQSRVTRRPEQRAFLQEHGGEVWILRLQGFIFFGTADRLLERIEQRLHNPGRLRPRYLILDFRRVTGMDATALLSFAALGQQVQAAQVMLLLTEVDPGLSSQLSDALGGAATTSIFSDLDRGLAWAESRLLADHGLDAPQLGPDENVLQRELRRLAMRPEQVDKMLAYFQREQVRAGAYLMRQGESAEELFLLESGRVTARLQRSGGDTVRLQTMEGGHVLGEIGFFLGQRRTADVVADEPSVVYRLSASAWEELCAQDPHTAATLYQLIVQLLGERVTHLVSAVDALRR